MADNGTTCGRRGVNVVIADDVSVDVNELVSGIRFDRPKANSEIDDPKHKTAYVMGKHLHVVLRDCWAVSVRRSSDSDKYLLQLQTTDATNAFIVALDDALIDAVQCNLSEWFSSSSSSSSYSSSSSSQDKDKDKDKDDRNCVRLPPQNMIADMYQPSVIVRKSGAVTRFVVSNDESDGGGDGWMNAARVAVTLRFRGLRFHKKKITSLWRIQDIAEYVPPPPPPSPPPSYVEATAVNNDAVDEDAAVERRLSAEEADEEEAKAEEDRRRKERQEEFARMCAYTIDRLDRSRSILDARCDVADGYISHIKSMIGAGSRAGENTEEDASLLRSIMSRLDRWGV